MSHILIIDNFDSFTFNLVDYFELLGCKTTVFRNTISPGLLSDIDPDIMVVSPGPSVPSNAGNLMSIIAQYETNFPIFGVCLGHEALIEHFGGSLKYCEPVHGKPSPVKHDGQTIFTGLPQNFKAGRYHSLIGDKIPDCFEITATHEDIVMGIRHRTLPIEAVQFHPESVLTMQGNHGLTMIKNLLKAYG